MEGKTQDLYLMDIVFAFLLAYITTRLLLQAQALVEPLEIIVGLKLNLETNSITITDLGFPSFMKSHLWGEESVWFLLANC